MKKFYLLLFMIMLFFLNSSVFAVEVSAPHAILIDMDTGKTLYEKDAYSAVYPASTTKVLTAILALENCNLDDIAKVSYTAIHSVYADGTTANLLEGEEYTIEELLYTMLVHSANDAAYVLAEHIGGTTKSFCDMMNARAKELGAKATYFVNPNGLPSTSHKCSAYDMALFGRYAMKNFPVFREMVSSTSYNLRITQQYEEFYFRQFPNDMQAIRYLGNTTNHLINPKKTSYYYEYATGIKTGYTTAAANCLVASAKKDGVEVVVCVFGANGWNNLRNDVVGLFEYGFSRLKSEQLAAAGQIVETVEISNGVSDANMLNVVVQDELRATFASTDYIEAFTPSIVLNPKLKAPIQSGDIIGTITYDVYNSTYTTNLLAGNAIEEKVTIVDVTVNIFWFVLKIALWAVGILVALFIALVFLRAYIITKRNRTRSMRRRMYNSRFR